MSSLEYLIFDGKAGSNVTLFLQRVKQVAFAQCHQRDNDWLADYVEACLTDDALVWYDALDESTQRDFGALRTAMLLHFIATDIPPTNIPSAPPAVAGLLPPLQIKRRGRIRVVVPDQVLQYSLPTYCGQEQVEPWRRGCNWTSEESESLVVELCAAPNSPKQSLLRVVSADGSAGDTFLGVFHNESDGTGLNLECWRLCVCDAGVSSPYPRATSINNPQEEAASRVWSLADATFELSLTWVRGDSDPFRLNISADKWGDLSLHSSKESSRHNAKLYLEPLR